jgi:hypothetical protein
MFRNTFIALFILVRVARRQVASVWIIHIRWIIKFQLAIVVVKLPLPVEGEVGDFNRSLERDAGVPVVVWAKAVPYRGGWSQSL